MSSLSIEKKSTYRLADKNKLIIPQDQLGFD